MQTRRDLGRDLGRAALSGLALAGLGGLRAAKGDSTYKGVKLGLITGSLNPLPEVPAGKDIIDTVIAGCVEAGAANIELGSLDAAAPGLAGREVVVMCGHGERAATAASVLERAGVTDVAIQAGGPDDWAAATPGRAVQVDW